MGIVYNAEDLKLGWHVVPYCTTSVSFALCAKVVEP